LFDAEVFSCSVGLRKPDPRIYLLACDQLGVEPQETMFVGDGANDELAGAERVGITAVLLERAGEEQEWAGQRVRSLPELLSLV
jgi:putative hydrolase of the HAD superfamily